MATFFIIRPTFPDRTFAPHELRTLVDMLRQWCVLRTANSSQVGEMQFEVRLSAVPRQHIPAISSALTGEVPNLSINPSDPDDVRVRAIAQRVNERPDLRLWEAVLGEPLLAPSCVMLRLTFTGIFKGLNGQPGEGKSTFAFYGTPIAGGGLLLKAIWHVGMDERLDQLYSGTSWMDEQQFLAAFNYYNQNILVPERDPRVAVISLGVVGKRARHLFGTFRDERKIGRLARHLGELPGDFGPAGFLRRCCPPFIAGVALIVIPFLTAASRVTTAFSIMIGLCLLSLAGRIVFQKAQSVRRYYRTMRAGLGKTYEGPIAYQQVDLSQDRTPTLLKCSAELEALGARPVADVSIRMGSRLLEGNRVFNLATATVVVGMVRKAGTLTIFPAKLVLIVLTRFEDGRRLLTTNTPYYRKNASREVTMQSVLDANSIDDVLALHDRKVQEWVSSGVKPQPAASTFAAYARESQQDHEESRREWQRSPYSWSDALHQSFRICRREYLKR